jgi:MYXO-CTERM domain-containing protein
VYGAGRDALVFGQGASVDFAYDGDVVAHEIGHAVVASTADFGDELLDEWGADIAPRALDEALADYFSSARAGDPRVGEYAGSGDWSAGEIRNLAVTAPYPTALRGEAHIDSVPFSSTLWAIRERLGSEFDRAVYEALTMASVDVTNDSLAEQVVAATRRVLGESAGTTAAELFATRGVLPRAARVLPYPAQAGRVFMLPDVSMADLPYVPGYVQFRISAGAGADRLTFDLPVYTRQPPRLRVFVRANEPVRFRYPAPGVIEAEALAEIAPDTRTTRVQGVVRFEPLASAGSLYVAIGVEDSGQAWAGPIRLSVPGGANPPGDAGVSTDAGADAGAEPPTEFNGCGCRTMPQGRTGAGVALVALGLLAMRRMRRGGRSRAH